MRKPNRQRTHKQVKATNKAYWETGGKSVEKKKPAKPRFKLLKDGKEVRKGKVK